MPIDPGRWGRPPAATRTVLPGWVPVGAPPPPPPPAREPIPPRGRAPASRRRRALIEALVAAGILATVGIASAGGAPPSTPASSTALSAWGRAGVPAITTLIDDLAPIERDTADPATALPSALGGDAARLQSDLTAARRLPGPPSRTVAAVWNETLSELSSAERTMHVAATTLDPAAIALAHQEFAAGGDGLLQLGQAVQASA